MPPARKSICRKERYSYTLLNSNAVLTVLQVLGGDSAVNGLVWTRASKAEYNAFETLGSEGWNWDTLYPHMKNVCSFSLRVFAAASHQSQVEHLDYPSDSLINEYGVAVTASSLGSSGPVDVSYPAFIPL